MSNKIYYNNADLEKGINTIIRQMFMDNWRPDFIIGVLRGGIVPAVYLSHWINVPMMAIEWSNRDNAVGQNINNDEIIRRINYGQKVLVVDDICDSGITLKKIATQLNEIWHHNHLAGIHHDHVDMRTACLHHNIGQDVFEPNYYHIEINKIENPSWIVYSWENV